MHPDDVAEFVAESVEEVRRQLEAHPELRTGELALEDDVQLFIPVTLARRQLVHHAIPADIFAPSGHPIAITHDVPLIGAPPIDEELILHLDLTDFDGQPPTAQLLSSERTPLAPDAWPKALGRQVVIRRHRDFGRPFFCRPGLREFHTHPQHEDKPWDEFREGMPLHAIVNDILFLLQDRHAWSK